MGAFTIYGVGNIPVPVLQQCGHVAVSCPIEYVTLVIPILYHLPFRIAQMACYPGLPTMKTIEVWYWFMFGEAAGHVCMVAEC